MPTKLILLCLALAVPARAGERIVSAGGGVTETLYALGLESRIVGVDTSSTFPPQTARLPKVGYARALSAEGLLSLNPTHLVCYDEAGPPAVLDQLRRAGVRVLALPSEPTLENTLRRIETIAAAFGAAERGQALSAAVERQVRDAARAVSENPPRVLFIYARAGGTLNVSGRGTAADSIIQLAGAVNAVRGYEGYKPLTAEAALAASPDVLLLTTSGLRDAGGSGGLLALPGLRETPAAKNGRIVVMDDLLLLGFGPRLGEAVRELSLLLHQDGAATAALHQNKP